MHWRILWFLEDLSRSRINRIINIVNLDSTISVRALKKIKLNTNINKCWNKLMLQVLVKVNSKRICLEKLTVTSTSKVQSLSPMEMCIWIPNRICQEHQETHLHMECNQICSNCNNSKVNLAHFKKMVEINEK